MKTRYSDSVLFTGFVIMASTAALLVCALSAPWKTNGAPPNTPAAASTQWRATFVPEFTRSQIDLGVAASQVVFNEKRQVEVSFSNLYNDGKAIFAINLSGDRKLDSAVEVYGADCITASSIGATMLRGSATLEQFHAAQADVILQAAKITRLLNR